MRGMAGKVAHRLHILSRRPANMDKRIDYENPIVYAAIDSALSLPCERNSVVIINDDKAKSRQRSRRVEYEACRVATMGKAAKGEIDEALSSRLKDVTAFMNVSREDSMECGPSGYPCSQSGLPISGNHMSGKVLSEGSRGTGMGIVG